MPRISIDNCNFMNSGVRCDFRDGIFSFEGLRTLKPEDGKQVITMRADEIASLNKPPRPQIKRHATSTNVFRAGRDLAIMGQIARLITGRDRKNKNRRRIIVTFDNKRSFSGYTDMDTFYAVQNAWLDSRTQTKTNLETSQ